MRYTLNEAELAALPPDEQEKVRSELLAIEARLKANPLEGFTPHRKQAVLLASRAPIRLFAGGNRSGKTTIGVVDDLIQSLDRDMVPESLVPFKRWEPPFHLRVILPDLIDTWEGVFKPKILEWCPPAALRGGSFEKAYSMQYRVLHFKNSSSWQFMSHEQDLLKMGGSAKHRIHYDEEPPEDVRKENQMRLLDYGGEELFTMTPLQGMTWMYDSIYLAAERLDYIDVVEVDIDENPHIDSETKNRTLAEHSPEERAARKSGKFVSFAGLVYGKEFDIERHVVPEHKVPENVEVYTGIDPGIHYMCGVLWAYLTVDDVLVVFDELAAQDQTIGQVCAQILQRNGRWDVTPRWNVIDPASRNRSKQTGRSDQMEFADQGVVTLPGQNSVPTGISAIKDRLNGTTDIEQLGKAPPRLLIAANCTELIKEFQRYRWKPQKQHRQQEEDDRRLRVVKKDDHLLDALRYLGMARPLLPELAPAVDNRSVYEKLLAEDFERSAGGSTVGHPQGNVYA